MIIGEALTVSGAFGKAMASGSDWACLAVARAHPKESFEFVEGVLPALWLAERDVAGRIHLEMLGMLTGADKEAAVGACSGVFAKKALDSIRVCMVFQAHWPERSAARRLRREAKLAKALARLMSGSESGLESKGLREACRRGVASALDGFIQSDPASAWWLKSLKWESVADQAVARAERKWLSSALAKSSGASMVEGKRTRL